MSWDDVAYRHNTDKARVIHSGAAGHGYMDTYQEVLGEASVGALLELGAYHVAKWGGLSGHETFSRPFDDPSLSLGWWPTPPDPRSIIGARP